MRVCSYNIGKGLWSKIGIVAQFLEANKIDIMFLIEAEIESSAPKIAGYKFLTEIEEKKKRRIVAYIKEHIACTQMTIERTGLAPHIVLNTAALTIIAIYNEFTAEAYSEDRKRLTKKQIGNKFRKTVKAIESTPHTSRKKLLLGDINLNWSSNEENIRSWARENDYTQVITKKTRGKSILDHIYGKNIDMPKGHVIESHLSDHKGVWIQVGKEKPEKKKISFLDTRKLCQHRMFIQVVPRSFIDMENELNEMLGELKNIQDTFTIVKTISQRGPPKWTKHSEVKSIRARLLRLKNSGSTEELKKVERQHRKLCKTLARREMQQEIEKNKKKNIWTAIKQKAKESLHIDDEKGERISNPCKLAQAFKESFEDKSTPASDGQKDIQKLVDEVERSTNSIRSWKLELVSEYEMLTAIKTIKPNYSAGPDGLHGLFMRSLAESIAPNITQLANMIITSGHYPKALVYGKSQPVFKGKEKRRSDIESYREITLVSVVGKIMEKIFAERIERKTRDTLPKNIFGYIKGRSTEDAIELLCKEKNQPKKGRKKPWCSQTQPKPFLASITS